VELVASADVGRGSERRSATALFVAAGISGALALALGAVAVAEAFRSDGVTTPRDDLRGARQAIAVLSKQGAERLPLNGSGGRAVLVAGPLGRAVLVLRGLEPAPAGRSYQAWRLTGGKSVALAVFSGREIAIPLGLLGPRAKVGVTLEREGGAERRAGRILFAAQRAAD
jgi:hypothetical protein